MTTDKPIYITGAGIVSSIGIDKKSVLSSLLDERSGISAIEHLKTGHKEFPSGEVKLSDNEMAGMLGIVPGTPTTRTSLMGMLALKEAPKPDDTADALAIAICHAHSGGSRLAAYYNKP